MARSARQRSQWAAVLLVMMGAAVVGAAGRKPAAPKNPAAPKKEPADPAGTTLYMTQLRGLFALWDSNGDKTLDKQELARVFRGRHARPYDQMSIPGDSRGAGGNKTQPNYSRYPDYIALNQLDLDSDGKVSREEFMTWARAYATQLKKLEALQLKLLSAQQKLLTATPGSRTYLSAQGRLNGHRANLAQMQPKVKALARALPPKVHQAMVKAAPPKKGKKP